MDGEFVRLRSLWDAATPVSHNAWKITDHIGQLSVCNWALEDMVLAICRSIGTGQTSGLIYGHQGSISDDRWRKVWAYYLSLRSWLPRVVRDGYQRLLAICDPADEIRRHVYEMLGEHTKLKELYVERFCLCLDWCAIGGLFDRESALGISHAAAVSAVENKIRELDPDGDILPWIAADGDGQLEPCHHKAFRRYDIIISSIGTGRWHGAMPERKTDGFDRAEMHTKLIRPLTAWLAGNKHGLSTGEKEVYDQIGAPDASKRFLVTFLEASLRAQQHEAQEHEEQKSLKK